MKFESVLESIIPHFDDNTTHIGAWEVNNYYFVFYYFINYCREFI